MSRKIWAIGDKLLAADLNAMFHFGGDGSDGALSITSGTTTIDLGAAQIVIKQYTSISITATGKLAFSNPHANGTIIILKSQGNVTLTSDAPCISVKGIGGAGGAAVASGNDGNDGKEGTFIDTLDTGAHYGAKGLNSVGGTGGLASTAGVALAYFSSLYDLSTINLFLKRASRIACGSGGGSGGNPASEGGVSGAGGNGGGALLIECGGAWNFTTAGGIDISGNDGTDATGGGYPPQAGGGGGGSIGMLLVLYNTLTANSGTITAKGGDGGDGKQKDASVGTAVGGGSGGAGGGSYHAGGNGGAGGNAGVAGSNGNDATADGGGGGGGGGGAGSSADTNVHAGGTGGLGKTSTVNYLVTQNYVFN